MSDVRIINSGNGAMAFMIGAVACAIMGWEWATVVCLGAGTFGVILDT